MPLGHDYEDDSTSYGHDADKGPSSPGRPDGTEQGMGIHVLEWVEDPREPGRVSLTSFFFFFFLPSICCLFDNLIYLVMTGANVGPVSRRLLLMSDTARLGGDV